MRILTLTTDEAETIRNIFAREATSIYALRDKEFKEICESLLKKLDKAKELDNSGN